MTNEWKCSISLTMFSTFSSFHFSMSSPSVGFLTDASNESCCTASTTVVAATSSSCDSRAGAVYCAFKAVWVNHKSFSIKESFVSCVFVYVLEWLLLSGSSTSSSTTHCSVASFSLALLSSRLSLGTLDGTTTAASTWARGRRGRQRRWWWRWARSRVSHCIVAVVGRCRWLLLLLGDSTGIKRTFFSYKSSIDLPATLWSKGV